MESFFTLHNLVTLVAFAVIMLIAGIPLHAIWRFRNRK
jgi:hypothetical protein